MSDDRTALLVLMSLAFGNGAFDGTPGDTKQRIHDWITRELPKMDDDLTVEQVIEAVLSSETPPREAKQPELDAAGEPKVEPTMLERLAVEALNEVKAWRDSDGNEGFPHETRVKVEAVLMTYEQRRIQRNPSRYVNDFTQEKP